jgi:hypothetical protein
MAGITTALPSQFKVSVLQGGHCFNGSGTATGTTANTSTHITALSSLANVAIGCSVSGTNVPANSFVGAIDSTTSCYITQACTGAGSPTLTFVGHNFNCALMIATVTGTYGAGSVQWGSSSGSPTTTNLGTDELAGSGGYIQGGQACGGALNTTPVLNTLVAVTQPTTNPSWTSATFSTSGCMIYNASNQTYCAYIGSFGGTQTVTAGTFTILLPTVGSTTSLIRIA